MAAIEKLNGHSVKGLKMKVTLAKYNKDGNSFPNKTCDVKGLAPVNRVLKFPSYRDNRRYATSLEMVGDTWTL